MWCVNYRGAFFITDSNGVVSHVTEEQLSDVSRFHFLDSSVGNLAEPVNLNDLIYMLECYSRMQISQLKYLRGCQVEYPRRCRSGELKMSLL